MIDFKEAKVIIKLTNCQILVIMEPIEVLRRGKELLAIRYYVSFKNLA